MAKQMPSPADVAAKWAKNLSQSTPAITAGIQRVTDSPMEAAARQQDAYVNGVQDAANSGKWARGLRRVSTQQWQDAAIKKGVPRIASGAQAAIPKMQDFQTQFLPYLAAGQARVNAMPKATAQDRIARAVAMIEYTSQFKRT